MSIPRFWKLWSHNLHYLKDNRADATRDASAFGADAVVWIETRAEDAALLGTNWPHGTGRDDRPGGPYGLRIASRHPILRSAVFLSENGEPAVRAVLDAPGGPVELAAVHLHPTLPHDGPRQVLRSFGIRRRQIESLLLGVLEPSLPQVVAGDFNAVPVLMPDLGRFSGFRDVLRERGAARPTYRYGLPLRIDHILAKGLAARGALTVRTPYSDHDAVAAVFDRGSGAV